VEGVRAVTVSTPALAPRCRLRGTGLRRRGIPDGAGALQGCKVEFEEEEKEFSAPTDIAEHCGL